MDADGQHKAEDVPRLLSRLDEGFDMVVGPDTCMGGSREPIEFVKIVRAAKVFGVPGAFSPSEFSYYLEREDGLVQESPVQVKSVHGDRHTAAAGSGSPASRRRMRSESANPPPAESPATTI